MLEWSVEGWLILKALLIFLFFIFQNQVYPSLLCSSQTFSSPRNKALCPLSSYSSFPPSELLATTNLLSASVVLPVSDISYVQNGII